MEKNKKEKKNKKDPMEKKKKEKKNEKYRMGKNGKEWEISPGLNETWRKAASANCSHMDTSFNVRTLSPAHTEESENTNVQVKGEGQG